MKKRRLFILIFAMLICIASVGCSSNKKTEDLTVDTEISDVDSKLDPQQINATVVSKFNQKEIIVYSDTSCFFNIRASVVDGENVSDNSYGEFEISKGETITLTLDDLAPGFFTDQAIITDVYPIYSPYVYEDSSLNSDNYKFTTCQLLMKYSSKDITISSDKSCFFDLYVSTRSNDFNSANIYQKLEIKEGETITLTLDDLAPGFFTDETYISYVNSYIDTYVEK